MAEATGNVLNVPGTSSKPTTTDDEILASMAGLNQKGLTLVKSAAAAFGTPTTPTAATATTGGTLPAATYYYVYTANSANGESVPSLQVAQATTGATSTVTVTMTAVSGAQNYKVYRASTTGGPYSLLATVPGGTVTYVDTGAVTPNGSLNPPSVDGSARTIWATGTVLKLSGTPKKYTGALAGDVTTAPDDDAVGILRKDVDVSQTDKLANIVLAGIVKGSKIRYADRYPLSVAELKTLAAALGGRYVTFNDTLHF